MTKTQTELEAEEAALAAQVSADHAEKALLQAEADILAARHAAAAAPDELVFTHRTSRGTLCACDFGAGEDGVGHGGHADGLHPELQEDGTVGARMAAHKQTEDRIEALKAEQARLEAELSESAT